MKILDNMSDWKEVKLNDIAEIYNNKRKPLSSIVRSKRKGPFPYYGASGIVDYIDDFIFDGDFVLISEDGENLRSRNTPISFHAKGKFWVNNHSHIIKGNERFLNDWIIYYLKNLDINPYLTGAVQPKLNKENLLSIPIKMPSMKVVESITEILCSLDHKIELNSKINQELENLAQTLFKQWFIDFEFPANLADSFLSRVEGYKSSGGDMVESELGEIPKGWEVKDLDQIADYLNGLALQKFPAQDEKDYLPVIKIRELRQGINQSSDKASTEVPKKYIIQNGDVLFAWSGSLMIDFWTNGEGALNQHLFKVTSENYPKWFYFYWTKYHLDDFIKIAESKATTMGHIQRKHLSEAKVTVPNVERLSIFNDYFENIVDTIISNREENQELINLRDTLLPKLISGELEVSELKIENE